MKQGKNGSSRRGQNSDSDKMVPVKIDGATTAFIKTGDISEWTHCHGKAQSTGQQVNSLKIALVGQSTIIKAESGFTASFDTNELEVASVAFLNGLGYTIDYKGQNIS